MGIPLIVEYQNGVLDFVCQEAMQNQTVRPHQNFPLKGAALTYICESSGEVVGAEILRFDEAFPEVVASVEALRLQALYDVPQLRLWNVPLEVVLRRCYEECVQTKGTPFTT